MDPLNQAHRAPSDTSSPQGHPAIYPPPPQAIFPIPRRPSIENSSGTSSPGFKRKRAVVDDGRDAGRSRTRASSTSDFNNNTKARVREEYNNKCWHCGASPADICHIIGSRDNTFHEALTHGLIDFQEKQNPQNAIALCGTCHGNFGHVYGPSFFFLPTDLNYFLNYERQDRKRRRKLGRRTGIIPARMCPTAQTYQDYQRHQGVEGAELGGLYTRIVINDFLPQYPGRAPFQPGLTCCNYATEAQPLWDSSGNRNALRQLQDAYSEELDLDGSDTSSQGSIEPGELEETDFEEGRGKRYEEKRREYRAKSQQSGTEQSSASGNREQDGEEHIISEDERCTRASEDKDHSGTKLEGALSHPRLHHPDIDCVLDLGNSSSWFWRWGPSATSEDAAKFFQRVL